MIIFKLHIFYQYRKICIYGKRFGIQMRSVINSIIMHIELR